MCWCIVPINPLPSSPGRQALLERQEHLDSAEVLPDSSSVDKKDLDNGIRK